MRKLCCQNENFIFIILIWFVKNIDIDWYMYMFIEFIFSGYTSYSYWLVFISPLDNNKKNPSHFIYIQLILKYICFKEFWIINKSKLLQKNVFVKSKMLPNLFYRIMFFDKLHAICTRYRSYRNSGIFFEESKIMSVSLKNILFCSMWKKI